MRSLVSWIIINGFFPEPVPSTVQYKTTSHIHTAYISSHLIRARIGWFILSHLIVGYFLQDEQNATRALRKKKYLGYLLREEKIIDTNSRRSFYKEHC